MPLDYKKEYKDLYLPKAAPMYIDVPNITFIVMKTVLRQPVRKLYMDTKASAEANG